MNNYIRVTLRRAPDAEGRVRTEESEVFFFRNETPRTYEDAGVDALHWMRRRGLTLSQVEVSIFRPYPADPRTPVICP